MGFALLLAAALVACGVAMAVLGPAGSRDAKKVLGYVVAKDEDTFSSDFERINAAGEIVRFGELPDPAEPWMRQPAVRVGERWLDLPGDFAGGHFFGLLTTRDGRRWIALSQFSTEAAGDVEVLASDDGGCSFEHRSTLRWPTYASFIENPSFDGENLEVQLVTDEELQLGQAYWSLLDRIVDAAAERLHREHLPPTFPPGRYAIRSKDGGRTFGGLVYLGPR